MESLKVNNHPENSISCSLYSFFLTVLIDQKMKTVSDNGTRKQLYSQIFNEGIQKKNSATKLT